MAKKDFQITIQGFGYTVGRPANFGLHDWLFIYLFKNSFVRQKNIKKKKRILFLGMNIMQNQF